MQRKVEADTMSDMSQHYDPFGPGSNVDRRLITDQEQLRTVVSSLKALGMRVVLTQGVYDLIHEGHAAYLEKAKSLGDILIVGVDSDELTKIRKGPKRPIVPQAERINMLLHLRHVDLVTIKEAHHGIGDIIEIVKPDKMVFSSSTKEVGSDEVEGYKQHCGEIIVLPPQATTTTTARVRNLSIEGVEDLAKEVNALIANFVTKFVKDNMLIVFALCFAGYVRSLKNIERIGILCLSSQTHRTRLQNDRSCRDENAIERPYLLICSRSFNI